MAHSEAFYKKPEECHYSFFQHKECEFFPCHKTDHPEDFNCLFCYCPLFALGKKCKGNFRYTENGVKDCSNCLIPHTLLLCACSNAEGYRVKKLVYSIDEKALIMISPNDEVYGLGFKNPED